MVRQVRRIGVAWGEKVALRNVTPAERKLTCNYITNTVNRKEYDVS